MANETTKTTCCIVGGGPAGMMLGYLLARADVAVTILEKHPDFNRDFRGDTVHPSTLDVMHELGLLESLLKLPHQKLTSVGGVFGDFEFKVADFRHVPACCKFVALMPQWDLLNFLASEARRFPAFDLRMQHEATGLLSDADRITGVEARTPQGTVHILADLVVGCDGRRALTRRAAHFEVIESGVPIDVLWFRISRKSDDPEQIFGNINYGKVLILINREDYYQSGLIVPKGSFEEIKQKGLDAFRSSLLANAPYLGDRVEELSDWDQIKLLSVQINRLRKWSRPGLLCIGDAAHAMSPAGGIGINLAIQDAVATANILTQALLERRVTPALLARVQRRREFPTRVTQLMQVGAHNAFESIFRQAGPMHAPWLLRTATSIPALRDVMGRVVGMGVLPEHVHDPRTPRPGTLERFAVCLGRAIGISVKAMLIARRLRTPQREPAELNFPFIAIHQSKSTRRRIYGSAPAPGTFPPP